MNWRLIFLLSLLGLAMAIATVFWIPENIEWVFWLVIFLVNAYFIAKYATGKYFWNGFMVSIFNCVYIVGLHVMFYATYMDNHPMMAKMGGNMPMHNHPRLGMILTGPLVGIALGLVQGLFAWLASKIIKRPEVAA
jgi:hypothetical protein